MSNRSRYLEMHNQYPIVFLMQRSRDIGYDISIDDEVDSSGTRVITFHYQSSAAVLRPTYVLEWGKYLISFQPTLQTARQVNAVTVTGWNVQTKQADFADGYACGSGEEGGEGGRPGRSGRYRESAIAKDRDCRGSRLPGSRTKPKQVAEKTLRQLAQGFVEAKGKTIGLPDLRAGSKVNIYMYPMDAPPPPPPADRFSGTYQVTSTTHTHQRKRLHNGLHAAAWKRRSAVEEARERRQLWR